MAGRREEEAAAQRILRRRPPSRTLAARSSWRPPSPVAARRPPLYHPISCPARPPAPVQLCGRSKGQEHGTYPSTPDTLASFSLLSAG
uniref:Uncharacterized protein n=1 Tax=Oryza glumipatula TaxID=40148 RepID=A0A0D9YPC7_9ORYZ